MNQYPFPIPGQPVPQSQPKVQAPVQPMPQGTYQAPVHPPVTPAAPYQMPAAPVQPPVQPQGQYPSPAAPYQAPAAPYQAPAQAQPPNRASIAVGAFRRPSSKTNRVQAGAAKVLLTGIEWKTTRSTGQNYISINGTVVEPIEDGRKVPYGHPEYTGYLPGDSLNFAIFGGDYFDNEVGEFVAAISGVPYNEILQLPEETFLKLYEAALPTAPGQVTAYVGRTIFQYSAAHAVNKDGNISKNPITNYTRHVKFSEIGQSKTLQDHHITMVFGSVEQFAALQQAEAQMLAQG